MEESEHESIIPQEEHIHIAISPKKEEPQEILLTHKYATVNQIKSFERASELHNQQLIETRPLLFASEDDFTVPSFHFISEKGKESYTKGTQNQKTRGILQANEDSFTVKLPVSNIKRENTLIMSIKNLKRRFPLELQNVESEKEEEHVKYKYILLLNEINLLIKVLVNLGGQFKVWKEMEVPLTENKFTLQIHEFNNEQTDIKVNDFLFHLILKMPFHEQSNYCFVHRNKADIEKVQFISKSQKKGVETNEAYCTKDCQLI